MAAQSRGLRLSLSRSLSGDGVRSMRAASSESRRTARSGASGSSSLGSSNSGGSGHSNGNYRGGRRRPKNTSSAATSPQQQPRRLMNGGRSVSDDGIVFVPAAAASAADSSEEDAVPPPPALRASASWGSAGSSSVRSEPRTTKKHQQQHGGGGGDVPPPSPLRDSASWGTSSASASTTRRSKAHHHHHHHHHHHRPHHHHQHHHHDSNRTNNSGDGGMPFNNRGRSLSDSFPPADAEGVPPASPIIKSSKSTGSAASSSGSEASRMRRMHQNRCYSPKTSSSSGNVIGTTAGDREGSALTPPPTSKASAVSYPEPQPRSSQLQAQQQPSPRGGNSGAVSSSNMPSESATTKWKSNTSGLIGDNDSSSRSSDDDNNDEKDDDIKKPRGTSDDEDNGDGDEDMYAYAASRVPVADRIVRRVQSFRYHCGRIVNHNKVQLFIVTLIAINALMMGIATFDFVRDNPAINQAFEITDRVFLIIFTVELFMQFVYLGWRILLDGWLVFDLIIILTSWSFQSVQIIRAFRIFRALRLVTRIKTMKNLVLALFSVMPRMFAIGLLLFLVSYIFAVMFTQLFKDMYDLGQTDADYFGRLDSTFFTLFQIMTLDNWADIARQVMAEYSWAWFPFIVFVIVTGFVVVNLIIAVICDAIAALHDDEKAMLHGTYGDTDDEDDESEHPALKEDVREQLDALETHVEELTRMQDETMMTLQSLAQHIQEHRKNT